MFEWLFEAVGVILLSGFLLAAYTYWIAPIAVFVAALAVAVLTKIKRKWKILILAVPSVYFGLCVVGFYFLMLWMTSPF